MGSRRTSRRRSSDGRAGSAYCRLQHNEEVTETEFVKVPNDTIGYIIGKDGCTIREIMESSGALITSPKRHDERFSVRGDAGQRECAKKLILKKVQELQDKKSERTPAHELVEIPSEYKGLIIGRGGENLRQISSRTGAEMIRKGGDVYLVSGTEEQKQHAKQLISDIVQRKKSEEKAPPRELVVIPREYKGLIIGKGGDNLRYISTMTGAKLISKDREVYMVGGTEEQRQRARVHIKTAITVARLRGIENKFAKACVYVDGWNLPEDCEFTLERLGQGDRMVHPGWNDQYRLKPSYVSDPQVCCNSSTHPDYLPKLVDDALGSLRKIKEQMATENYLKADMSCHFGTAIIRGPDEVEAEEGQWTIEDVRKRFQLDSEGSSWRTSFKEGVNLDEKILQETHCKNTPEEYLDYAARYDLAFLTPCCNEIRFKVWITRETTCKKLEDIPIPFSDVKNILDEILFEDEATRSRCRGWLVLPSRKYLRADILFPGCEFDCRITIRGRMESALLTDYVPDEESRQTLSGYLCGLTLTETNGLKICLPDMPEGFHLIHKRRSERSLYEIYPGFPIIFSKESSWRSDLSTEESRESTDLHLHCREWDELLNSGDWEPEKIAEKLPEFLQFVKDVHRFVQTKTDH